MSSFDWNVLILIEETFITRATKRVIYENNFRLVIKESSG